MARMAALLLALSAAFWTLASAAEVEIVTFDGEAGTTFNFVELNDPVMGGRSTGTWTVDTAAEEGVMDGEVVNVPSLKAPGFIKASADGKFPDVSAAAGGELVLQVRSSTPDYQGFRVSFASGTMAPSYACAGGGSIPLSRGCFKAKFHLPAGAGNATSEVVIPFANFSDRWSPATGDQTVTCAQDSSVCPTAEKLRSIQRVELWAEGITGKVHLQVHSISARSNSSKAQDSGSAPAAAPTRSPAESRQARPPSAVDTCKGPVQSGLLYGISGRKDPDVPVPVSSSESLAEAVCCDNRTLAYAEPQFLYQAPDINLFGKISGEGGAVTTFYDSVCGLPLFRAPVNRSLMDFRADTEEHGWPSFRTAEVVSENVRTDTKTGLVSSVCGTHLGTYLPDAQGARWCIDLSCVAGRPKAEAEKEALSSPHLLVL